MSTHNCTKYQYEYPPIYGHVRPGAKIIVPVYYGLYLNKINIANVEQTPIIDHIELYYCDNNRKKINNKIIESDTKFKLTIEIYEIPEKNKIRHITIQLKNDQFVVKDISVCLTYYPVTTAT